MENLKKLNYLLDYFMFQQLVCFYIFYSQNLVEEITSMNL